MKSKLLVSLSVACLLIGAPAVLAHPPSGIAVDDEGVVYFQHVAVGIWQVDKNGKLTLGSGPGYHHIELDPDGRFISQRWPSFPDGVIRAVGKDPTLLSASSFPLAIGADGALYYPEAKPDGYVHILRLEAGGKPTEFTRLPHAMEEMPDGTSQPALWIHGFAAGADGSFYYAEKEGVQKIDAKGVVTPVVAKITLDECVHPSAITDDRGGVVLRGLDVAPDGNVYAASAGCSALLKITPAGDVSVALQERDGWAPTDVDAVGDKLYVHEFYYIEVEQASDWRPRVKRIDADGTVTTLATVTETPQRATSAVRD
jgi:hypothetical protein